jgi:hypothetical protein
LLADSVGESKGKEPRTVSAYIPNQIPKRKASKLLQENHQEKALKITKKNEWEQHIEALRNHAESLLTVKFNQPSHGLPLVLA